MIRVSRMIAFCLFMILLAFRTNAVISIAPQDSSNSIPSNVKAGNASDDNASAPGDSTFLEDPLAISNTNDRLGDTGSLSSSNESIAEDPTHAETYDTLYQKAVKHYLDEEWHECAGYSQMAIADYHWYTNTLTACRSDCKAEAEAATPLTDPRDNSQVFFETSIRNALCLLKCRRTHFGSRREHVAPANVDRDFEIMKPYDYMQLCLFKLGRFQEAASAAVTVLARQPEHTVMSNNLRQYIDDYSADPDQLDNLELQEYAREYVRGDRAHADEDFEKSVEHMEAALTAYWRGLEDCRLMCEEPFDQGWFPDFVSSIANHFTFTFRCKRRCPTKLSNLYGEEITNFLPSIFNYLQFGYHKLNNVPAACGAVESFLELVPTDATMLRNKQFYYGEYQKSSRHFVPRKEVVEHAARERYEEALLNFIDTEFVFLEDDKEIQLRKDEEKKRAEKLPSIRETLSDLLSSVFPSQPAPIDGIDIPSKGEL